MPVTPLHYCAAYLVNKVKVRLILPALIVGSVIPDVESFVAVVVIREPGPARGLMHSLLGAVTFDTFFAVVVTILLYPFIVSWIFKLEKKSVSERCRFSYMLVLSAFLGSLSHVLIDLTHHEYNPFFYPFINDSFDALVFMGDWVLASTVVSIVFLGLLLLIFVYEVRKGTDRFWSRLLVG